MHKDGKEWRATRHSYICSKHFEKYDYVTLPCSGKTCRLKKNAVPSLFKLLPPSSPNHNIPEEARSRLEIPEQSWSPKRHARKRQNTDEEISMPAAKILIDHNYAKSENEVNVPPKKQDPEITNKKLKSKIRNLQQQLRRSKKKMTKMADIINNLQQNLIIKSEVADELHATFDKLQLSLFYNTKKNNSGRDHLRAVPNSVFFINYNLFWTVSQFFQTQFSPQLND